jgi:DNA-binding response OmpR family regulator
VKKILVVDNEEDVVEVLRLVLGAHGYRVLTATSGIDGLAQAQSELPELILLDIMMHQMDGWEVLKLLKMDERTLDIPVIILSARVEPKDKIRGLQEGAIDYVTKPFAVREILGKVASVLGGPPAGPAESQPESPAGEGSNG